MTANINEFINSAHNTLSFLTATSGGLRDKLTKEEKKKFDKELKKVDVKSIFSQLGDLNTQLRDIQSKM